MSKVEDLDVKYDVKRHILVVIIVAIVLIFVFVLFPLHLDLILGEPTRRREPSERLHDSFPLILNLIHILIRLF